MIFLGIALFSVVLYILNYKVPAMLIFFFYLTSGFNLVPEEVTKVAFFSKGMDYALIAMVGIIAVDAVFLKDFLKPDKQLALIALFFVFLTLCIIYNRMVIGVGVSEIIRTVRYNAFWMMYLIFRCMSREQLERVMKYLFLITIVCSVIYIMQIPLDKSILNEAMVSKGSFFGIELTRFYNQPEMLAFFVFISLYNNPLKGIARIVSILILIAALLLAMHRSVMGFFIITVAVGIVLKLPKLQRIKVVSVACIVMLFAISFVGYKFVRSRTFTDLKTVVTGEVAAMDMDLNINELQESTFTFRIAHLLERNQYLLDNPRCMIFGAGLMTEDSRLTYSLFNFDIGLVEELTGMTTQLDTGDISWSVLLLRYGYVGTLINLLLFIMLTVSCYRWRHNPCAFAAFLFLIYSFGVSFFSNSMNQVVTFILPMLACFIVRKTDEADAVEAGSETVET
jgi:hypothetical protein